MDFLSTSTSVSVSTWVSPANYVQVTKEDWQDAYDLVDAIHKTIEYNYSGTDNYGFNILSNVKTYLSSTEYTPEPSLVWKFFTGIDLVEGKRILSDLFHATPSDGTATTDKVRQVLNNAWSYLCKLETNKEPELKGSVQELMGFEPVAAVEGDEECASGEHRLHSCDCVLAEECGCTVHTDVDEKICTGCNQCSDCCDSDGYCFTCSGCDGRKSLNDNSQCSCCDQCETCCSGAGNCYYCEGCKETKSSSCGTCERCDGCCSCWECSGCDGKYSHADEDIGQCSGCECCEDCCKCYQCESCSEKHTSSHSMCSGCNQCEDCCECEDGFVSKKSCSRCGKAGVAVCPSCKRCKTCCPHEKITWSSITALTQKAKGIQALAKETDTWGSIRYRVPSFSLYTAADVKDKADRLVGRFVRPCPMTPRHGFVDSRVVNNTDEATAIINETLAADTQAEFIVMDCIKATHSAVWTPGMIVLGPGNDGATAGHGSFTLPVGGNYAGSERLLAGACVKQSPYVEMLWSEAGFSVVQLRDGPAVPQQVDYIAEQMVVTNVIEAQGDLLAWETLMKNQPAGTVVYHPGGSLASHYAVHAMLNRIPVLVSSKPAVGDILVPISGDAALTPNVAALRAGFHYGVTAKVDYITACYMMLLGCHNTVLWLGKHDLLLGVALGCCYRLSVTAGLGEWRYKEGLGNPNKNLNVSRNDVYHKVWGRVSRVRGLFLHALKDFRLLNWSQSIGGEKWFQFTRWAAVIFNAVRKGDATTALEAMNKAVNSSHNTGWGFNKFADDGAMSRVASNPVIAMEFCGRMVYDATINANKKLAKQWFKTRKPYPTNRMDKWLEVPVPLSTASIVNAQLDGDSVIVQCSPSANAKVYQVYKLAVKPEALEDVKRVLGRYVDNGLAVPSYIPGDTRSYVRSAMWNAYDSNGIAQSSHAVHIRNSSLDPNPHRTTRVHIPLVETEPVYVTYA